MLYKIAAALLLMSCLPAVAEHFPAADGDYTAIAGRAHVYKGALGTYIQIRGINRLAGFVPFGDEHAFPAPWELDGRVVRLSGVVSLDGLITMPDPKQLKIIG